MGLADDMPPRMCLEVIIERVGEDLATIKENKLEKDDSPRTTLEKLAIIEQALTSMKDSVKEGLKARVIGASNAADIIKHRKKDTTLDQYEDVVLTKEGAENLKDAIDGLKETLEESGATMEIHMAEGQHIEVTPEGLEAASERLGEDLEEAEGDEVDEDDEAPEGDGERSFVNSPAGSLL